MSLRLLLENPEEKGYPFPYVLARIRGRRLRGNKQDVMQAIPSSGRAEVLPMDADALLAAARAERNWLWHQLEPGMRRIYAPLFFYHELKPLALALRRREARQWGLVDAIMEGSLFVKPLRQLMVAEQIGTQEALKRLGRILQRISPGFGLLGSAYTSGRIGAIEELLLSTTLRQLATLTLQPCLRAFFIRLTDMLNLLSLFRHLHWHSTIPPIFVPGGRIRTTLLVSWLDGSGTAARNAWAASLTEIGVLPESPVELEQELMSGMTRLCRRLAREPEGIGLVVDYLWIFSQEVNRQGLVANRTGTVRRTGEELMA